MYHFLSQWNVGLQPSLLLNAKSNLEIAVSLNLTTSLPSKHNEEHFSAQITRNSGRRSRQKRRARRDAEAVAGSSRDTNDVHISSDVESEKELENLPVDPPVSTEPTMST